MYKRRKSTLWDISKTPLKEILAGCCYAVDEIVNGGYRIRVNNTTYTAIIYTENGSSDYTIKGKTFRIMPGSLLVLPEGISFKEVVPHNQTIHNVYIMIEGPASRAVCSYLPPAIDFFLWKNGPLRIIEELKALVKGIQEKPETSSWKFCSDLCGLIDLLKDELSLDTTASVIKRQVDKIIYSDVSRNLSLGEVASALNMSASSLAHTFSKECGVSPGKYMRAVKCAIALRLIREGVAIHEVSRKLGFSNPYYFSRAFKSEIGRPPSHFKPKLHRRYQVTRLPKEDIDKTGTSTRQHANRPHFEG
jgi:AraC-like DNA-binding protein